MIKQDVQPHDLIYGFERKDLSFGQGRTSLPDWISQLSFPCWGVVRRDLFTTTHIPVGLRGSSKSQRWGGFVCKPSVHKVLTPVDVRKLVLEMDESLFFGHRAFSQIGGIAKILKPYPLEWGITGSLGSQMVTGQVVTHPNSDLDIIIYAPPEHWGKILPLKQDLQRFLYLDVQIETPYGAFSLKEWQTQKDPILFKTNEGPRLQSLQSFL